MRPKIICHMMSTVDGRIIDSRWLSPYGGADIDTFTEPYFEVSRELEADAEMIGRKTVQMHHVPEAFDYEGKTPAKNPGTFMGKRETERLSIVMDPRGKIFYSKDTLSEKNIITILGESVSDEYLSHLRGLGISYLFAGPDGSDLVKAMDILGNDFSIRTILLQGGGIINGTFLKAGLVDELSLMIYPGVDGLSGVAAVFECAGEEGDLPAKGQALEFLSMEQRAHGVVWLRYKFHR